MNPLHAEGLNINITAEEACDWLINFLTKSHFSSPGAEKDRKFALIILSGIQNYLAEIERHDNET